MVKFKDYCVVDYVEHMGSDIRVDEAARVSTQTMTDPNRLEGIIKFLISNKHASPLEHSIITYKIEAPIFVAREWMRHRTQSFNEESGRYSIIKPICFVPSINRPVVQKGKVGAYFFEPDTKLMADVQDRFYHCYEYVFDAYDDMIASGVAKEVARMILPVGAYTKWFATANLRNWLNFLVLRNDSHAMEEIRLCAKLIEHHLHELFPICMKMWVEAGRPQI